MVMKLGRVLAVAMMVGALGALGCKSQPAADTGGEVAPEENPDTAPVVTQPVDTAKPEAAEPKGANAGHESYSYFGVKGYLAPVAPPAVKVEVMGVAPSPRHIWAPGYWRWSGREHVWYPGRWILRREGYSWVNAHWENRYGHWYYIPGHWRRY